MNRLQRVGIGLATTLLLTALLTARFAAIGGYPHAVYHEQLAVLTSNAETPDPVADTWSDPARGVLLTRWGSGPAASRNLVVGGRLYAVNAGGTTTVMAPAVALAAQFAVLAEGGYHALGVYLLAHAAGPVAHSQLAGARALRFLSTMAPLSAYDLQAAIVWLDARTLVPLQYQWAEGDGTLITIRYLHPERLAAHTLPADLFDPAVQHLSVWSRFTGWLHDHVRR